MKRNLTFKLRQAFLPLAVLLTGLSACGKDDDNTTPKPTTDLIVGTWKQTAMTSDVEIGGTKDLWSIWPACAKDGTETYKDNGERVVDEGPTKCSASGAQSTTAAYTHSGNTLQVGGFTFTILQLDNSILKYSYPTQSVDGSGDTTHFTATLTFQRQ